VQNWWSLEGRLTLLIAKLFNLFTLRQSLFYPSNWANINRALNGN
jgi:hypothetical protein